MGYLAAGADVNLARVEHFIQAIGFYEDQIFSKRAKMLERQKQRMREQRGGRSISGAAPTQARQGTFQSLFPHFVCLCGNSNSLFKGG